MLEIPKSLKGRLWGGSLEMMLVDHAILHSFMYMFLEWVIVHLGSSTLALFVFIDWLSCK